jgi:hypothetical protein
MKDYERLLDRLTRAAAGAPEPAPQLDPALAARVLAGSRAAPCPPTIDALGFLEEWCIRALPAAAAVALLLWLIGPRQEASGPAAAADGALAERLFAEALRS